MNLHPIDLVIIGVYLFAVAMVGVVVRKRATKKLDSFYLADRNIPWWMLGLSGCSSYIDIGGTMSMIGLIFYLGLKSIWATHIFWGWFIICFYMAFQAKYIRRSGVMTFAEWNETRFGTGKDAEAARLTAAIFLLVLMICNLMFISVGTGKFAEEFLPLPRWEATLIVLAVVGRLRDPGRVLRRHPDGRLPDAAHRRRRGHHGRHGLRQAGGDDLHPQGPGLVLARADVDAVVGVRGGDAAGLPAFRAVRAAHGGGLLLDDLPRPQPGRTSGTSSSS